MADRQKTAVVLFNLGGPTSLAAVRPFLFNLFNDKAIISAPQPIRFLLAKLISGRRAPIARDIYKKLGGKSPLLENTEAQAQALEGALKSLGDIKTFIAMRYWHPFAREAAKQVKAFAPDKIILLPLYPQFSITTTGSSLKDWEEAAREENLKARTIGVCCYPAEEKFIKEHVRSIKPYLNKAAKIRVLFTAHGLPEKIVRGGDPYQWQVEQTVAAIVKKLGAKNLDYVTCYQSRVGPLEWLKPSTEDEIVRAGKDGKSLIVVPIAFVSEHSETLVELDIEYKALAEANGVPAYFRVPTLDAGAGFIQGLAGTVKAALDREGLSDFEGKRTCPGEFSKCPCRKANV